MSPPAPRRPSPELRFGTRALLAAIALVLVAVPFGLLLLLVRDRWRPLPQFDAGTSRNLHSYAVDHPWFVTAMSVLSTRLHPGVAGDLRRGRRLAGVAATAPAGDLRRRDRRRQPAAQQRGEARSGRGAAGTARPGRARRRVCAWPLGKLNSRTAHPTMAVLAFLPRLRRAWRRLAVTGAVVMLAAIGFLPGRARRALRQRRARRICSRRNVGSGCRRQPNTDQGAATEN